VAVLGLPDGVAACLFDLDGVLTDTAAVHNRAWTQMFDAYLKSRDGDAYVPFDPDEDYPRYVDGRPRADGVRGFLESRGIELPDGDPGDPPDAETVHGLGNRKNQLLLQAIDRDGVRVFEGSRDYLAAARDGGLRRAVVSSSANTRQVLDVTGLAEYVEVVVDGTTVREEHLHGKPAPDTFLVAADRLGVGPDRAAVFEDATSGVEAGRAGGFRCVVGVDRIGHANDLRAHGADIVVADLTELLGGTGR
jgi:beta-phosphoglucomutase family hydrolase